MTYTEDFRHILEKKDEVINANLFVFKNSKPSSIKVFPEEVSSVLLTKYFETLSAIMEENEFVPYIPTSIERNTLQVIDTEVLTLWPAMKSARDEIQNVDRVEITVDDYNCTGNTILMDIEFDNGEHVFYYISQCCCMVQQHCSIYEKTYGKISRRKRRDSCTDSVGRCRHFKPALLYN